MVLIPFLTEGPRFLSHPPPLIRPNQTNTSLQSTPSPPLNLTHRIISQWFAVILPKRPRAYPQKTHSSAQLFHKLIHNILWLTSLRYDIYCVYCFGTDRLESIRPGSQTYQARDNRPTGYKPASAPVSVAAGKPVSGGEQSKTTTNPSIKFK